MTERLGSSFRDPRGFLFQRDGVLFRQVNPAGAGDYDTLMQSGLAERLWDEGSLVRHEEVEVAPAEGPAHRILRPRPVPFVSYPYEWSFQQLKQAALLTLHLQARALDAGMTLVDASAYNIQFPEGGPRLIDTLSFARYREGEPWAAYGQFCRHFLAPLALMTARDVRLGDLLRTHLDGLPLDLCARLLPRRSRLNPGLALHIHAHAATQKRYGTGRSARRREVDRKGLRGIVENLDSTIRRLRWQNEGTEWGDYYRDTNYSAAAHDHKATLVGDFLDRIAPSTVWDLGANDGRFSRLASDRGAYTVALDQDPVAVDTNYRRIRREETRNLLPLLMDLTNPSPAQGFGHRERLSLAQRGPAECLMALALVHHLALGHNVPLPWLAHTFASWGRDLIVEWIPKEDSQVQRMLATREDVFDDYTREGFEGAFATRFALDRSEAIQDSGRRLYLLRGRT